MASGLITLGQIEGGKVEAVTDCLFLDSKITANADWSHEIKRCFFLGRKAMTNLLKKKRCKCQAISHVQLCNPMDCSPSGSSVLGILQARILKWVAFPSPGDLPDPRIKPRTPTLQEDSLPSEPPGKPISNIIGSLFLRH